MRHIRRILSTTKLTTTRVLEIEPPSSGRRCDLGKIPRNFPPVFSGRASKLGRRQTLPPAYNSWGALLGMTTKLAITILCMLHHSGTRHGYEPINPSPETSIVSEIPNTYQATVENA